MEYFEVVFNTIWSIMSIQLTFGSFTITLGGVFLFSIMIDFAVIALFYYLWS